MPYVVRSLLRSTALLLLLAPVAAEVPAWVPEELRPWIPWVSQGGEHRGCPFLLGSRADQADDFRCAWPGLLRLTVGADGASFEQDWRVEGREQWIPLPGEAEHWPVAVQQDGRAAAVFEHRARPALRLSPGEYRISGRLLWPTRPATLQIPAETGLLALTIDGAVVHRPRRDEAGRLYLGADDTAERREDSLALQVFRLIEDAAPTRLTVRLKLDVAGAVREHSLGHVLPPGFLPQRLSSRLPARIDPDGRLRLQLSPGSWTLTLVAHAETLLDRVERPSTAEAWPETEIWSYRGDDRLRVAVPEGMQRVDPAQTGVPRPWIELPAFILGAGEPFRLATRRRGGLFPDNDISLERDLWLDFDGAGLTVVDRLNGRMHRHWRLDMLPPYRLLGARDRTGEPLLITASPGGERSGVEWREQDLMLQSVSRVALDGGVPVSGWSERLNAARATLHLPPGYRLAAVTGADQAPSAWLGQWRLLDLFVVLLTAMAAGRLYGPAGGALTLAALVVIHQDLPAFSWLLLSLMAAVALSRAAPEGRLRTLARGYCYANLAALVLLFVPFAVTQIKLTLYPQLEVRTAYAPTGLARTLPARARVEEEGAAAFVPRSDSDAPLKSAPVRDKLAPQSAPPPEQMRYAPGAPLQTGPGLPAWRWRPYALGWSGPVEPTQTLRLMILPPWAVAVWRLAMVALGLAVLWWTGRDALGRLPRIRLPAGATAAGVASVLLLSGAIPGEAEAEMPSPQLLEQLRARLLRAPDCAPDCGSIASARVTATDERLELILEVNTLERLAVPLPGSEKGWRPESVDVDDGGGGQVLRDEAGTLWLALAAGEHRIALAGRLAADKVELSFPLVPRRVLMQAPGWSVNGLRGERLAADALVLNRERPLAAASGGSDRGSSRFPDYLRVERSIDLALDWTAITRVIRIAPAKGGISVGVPLLPGEAVVSEEVVVRDGLVQVALGSGQDEFVWRSTLEKAATLELRAPSDRPWTERWQFEVGDLWHLTTDGVPVYRLGDRRWRPVFLPLPGESLRLGISRPDPVQGAALAVDRVSLETRFGTRSAETSLDFDYRSALGGPHVIRVPATAELLGLSQDGEALPLPDAAGAIRIPTLPGSHSVRLSWREEQPIGFHADTPPVDLAAPAANISVTAAVPHSRWILGTGGPTVGPAVLYWPALATLALVAAVLGRIRVTPLRTGHWFLLGLGFSTFAWPVFALVAVWLLVLGWRERWSEALPDQRFRLLQVAIGALSVIALLGLLLSIPIGLLGAPDMQIAGNGSFGHRLNWFQDQTGGELPVAGVLSLPLWLYKVAILLWALWLSLALLRWLPWAWRCYSRGGIWRGRVKPA